ncbi:MAG: hypothetical protein RLZZ127_1653 [Planctomycetota bacterium]|jgi:phosphonate transport system permease protein
MSAIPAPPSRSPLTTLGQVAAVLAAVGVLAWAWQGAEMRPLELIANAGNSFTFVRDFAAVDLTDWRWYAQEMAVTVQIAIWGSFLAVVAAVPLGLMAASNISPWWLREPTRRVLDVLRAINEMVFALMFVVAVGLGPFAGALALAVHTAGILGKLFSEVVEAADPRPVEGIRATGAGRFEEIAYGIIPQVMPMWTSYALYRFESNVRAASVVGMVGAGGIGVVLWDLMRSFQYHQAGAVLLIVVITVMIIDVISAQIRRLLV